MTSRAPSPGSPALRQIPELRSAELLRGPLLSVKGPKPVQVSTQACSVELGS